MARRFVRIPPSGRVPQNRPALSLPGAVRRAPPGPSPPAKKARIRLPPPVDRQKNPWQQRCVCAPIRDLADPAGGLAVKINRGATRDPVQPGGGAAPRRVEGASRTPHLQEDILDQLLS